MLARNVDKETSLFKRLILLNCHFGYKLEALITVSRSAGVILLVVQALIMLLVPGFMHYVKLLPAISLP